MNTKNTEEPKLDPGIVSTFGVTVATQHSQEIHDQSMSTMEKLEKLDSILLRQQRNKTDRRLSRFGSMIRESH